MDFSAEIVNFEKPTIKIGKSVTTHSICGMETEREKMDSTKSGSTVPSH